VGDLLPDDRALHIRRAEVDAEIDARVDRTFREVDGASTFVG
jgi:hypothetical protein